MPKRVELKIFGKVQGVFYRISAQKKALELNLVGFVKNENDGTVKIIAEGNKNNLKQFISWCYSGPIIAKVEQVEEKWQKYQGGFNSFEIKY